MMRGHIRGQGKGIGRALWRSALRIFLAVFFVVAAPAWSDVEEDKSYLVRVLQDLLSDAGRAVQIDGFVGALSSQATIRQITIADDLGIWITLRNVVIDWNRAELLQGRVAVNELSAEEILLDRIPQATPDSGLPSATANEEFRLPELPVSVHIGLIEAERVELGDAILGAPAVVWAEGAMELNGGQGNARFAAERIDGTMGQFHVVADFDNISRLLNLDIGLSEGQGGIASTLLGIPGAPALSLSAHGTAPVATFAAEVMLAVDGEENITGRFGFVDETPETGALNGGGFIVDLAGDLRPLLVRDLHPFFGENSVLAATGQRTETGELMLERLAIRTQALEVEGRAELTATGFPTVVALTARLGDPTGAPVLLPGTNGDARLLNASLDISHDASVSRDWQMRAVIERLSLPEVQIASAVLDATGRLNALSGETETQQVAQPVFEGVFEFGAQGISADDPALAQALGDTSFGLASLEWRGAGQPLVLSGLALEADALSLTANGDITGTTFDGFIELETQEISRFSGLAGRDLAGHAFATLQGTLNPLTGAFDLAAALTTRDLQIGVDEADALLAGEAGITLSLVRDTEGTILREFDLRAGTVSLDARGMFNGEQSELSANLDARDLTRLGPGYRGQLALTARLDGQGARQRVRLNGVTRDITLGDLPVAGALDGLFMGETRLEGDLILEGDETQINVLTLAGPQIDASVSGRYAANAPNVEVALTRLSLGALGQGGRGDLRGDARAATDVQGNVIYEVSLRGDAPLRSGIAALDGLIAAGVTLSARAEQEVGTDASPGGFTLHRAQLRSGGLAFNASGSHDPSGAQRFNMDAQLGSLGSVVPGLQGAVRLTGSMRRAAGARNSQVSAVLNGPQDARLLLNGHVTPDLQLALDVSGGLQGALINPLIEPSNVAGAIQVSGSINGPAALSSLRLHLETQGARYVQPNAGVAFDQISASADLSGLSSRVRVEGRSLNGGRGRLSGTIDLSPGGQSALDVGVRGFTVRSPQLFEAEVSGEIRLTGNLQRDPFVRGTVTIDRAEIRIPNSPLSGAARVPQGLRHVGEGAASRVTRQHAGIARGTSHGRIPVPIRLDLTLDAPRRVFVRGRGLDAELGGRLRLGGTTRDTVPSGSFGLIRGRLDLLGNRFTLTEGSASMVGSFMPYVSLTATTESDGVTTGITLSGRANQPEISFWSTPDLPEDEVLARLIFRRPLTSLTPFQAAQLALSVATLTGRAESSFLGRAREALSLDDLDLTVDEQGNTALRAGRYINERVYTDLSVDNTGRGEVSINLDLTDDLTLRGRTDTEGRSGVGLFFERDY